MIDMHNAFIGWAPLQKVSSEAEIGGLLLSFLAEEEGLITQRLALEQALPHPFLKELYPLPQSGEESVWQKLQGWSNNVTACALSPDGKWIVSASNKYRTVTVSETATGEIQFILCRSDVAKGCAFSPDGKWFASLDGHDLTIWEVITGEKEHTLSCFCWAVAFSPNGKWIVSASWDDSTLRVWEIGTGTDLLILTNQARVSACAFSPDGKWIVSAFYDGTLKVREAATGTERSTLFSHTDVVSGCAFSPDGKWIVSASWDHTLKLWEVQSGRCVLTYPFHGPLWGCVFHPDGNHVVAYGAWGMHLLSLVW